MAALRPPKYDPGYISPDKINLGSPIVNLPGTTFSMFMTSGMPWNLRYIFVQSPNEEERIEFEQALLLAGLPPGVSAADL